MTRKGIQPDPKKEQGIMDIGRHTTTNGAQMLNIMVQYYMNMFHRQSHILDPLTEAAIGSRIRKIL